MSAWEIKFEWEIKRKGRGECGKQMLREIRRNMQKMRVEWNMKRNSRMRGEEEHER